MPTKDDTTLSVAYLTTARLGEKGQLTIPKEYRDTLALEAGTPITVLQLGSGLLLIPEPVHFRQLCDRITATFVSQGTEAQDVLATLPETRARVFARNYPELAQGKSTGKRMKRT